MMMETFRINADGPLPGSVERRTAANYELELIQHRTLETVLRAALASSETLLREKDDQIQQQALLSAESDHRLLNDLQLIVSLLSLQSRASSNVEAAEQLTVAANRVGMIARIHQRLHCLDGADSVAFGTYLEDLCRDHSAMLSSGAGPQHVIVSEGVAVDLPAATGISLGFIVSELLTNATKHGASPITVRLERDLTGRYVLSVSNGGSPLPEDFDPGAGRGLGMKIIRSFVQRIDGELRFGRGDQGQGANFSVLFF
jgi:two-component sensor histidine kinase